MVRGWIILRVVFRVDERNGIVWFFKGGMIEYFERVFKISMLIYLKRKNNVGILR